MKLLQRWSNKATCFGSKTVALTSLMSLFLLSACVGVEAVESPVPAYNVHYSCNISTINAALGQNDLPNLDSSPGVVLINQYQNVSDNIGVCGLLLYHAATEDVFYAYDLRIGVRCHPVRFACTHRRSCQRREFSSPSVPRPPHQLYHAGRHPQVTRVPFVIRSQAWLRPLNTYALPSHSHPHTRCGRHRVL